MVTQRPEEDKDKDPVDIIKDDLSDAKSQLEEVEDLTDDQMAELESAIGGSQTTSPTVSDQPAQDSSVSDSSSQVTSSRIQDSSHDTKASDNKDINPND